MTLARSVCESVIGHARDAAPGECCGLLLGRGEEIVDAFRARNVADDPARRFVIDPADHFAGRRAARSRELEVVGFYHSHPRSPAEPSPRDLAEFTYSGSLYLIVSLHAEPAQINVFHVDARNYRRLPFVTAG